MYARNPDLICIIKNSLKLDFSIVPFQSGYRAQRLSEKESKPKIGDYISRVFTRDEKGNSKSLILNCRVQTKI